MIDLRNLTLEDMQELMASLHEKPFRARQVFDWVNKGIVDFESMKNISKPLLEKLKEKAYLDNCKVIDVQKSKDGTLKVLNALYDGELVESVFMKYKHGYSACISTQVGCRMKCQFCASTINGMKRHLSAGEMLGQIYTLQNHTGQRINNVVLMGSGEPLDNYEASVRFIKMAIDEKGLNLSARHITLSTCGLVPQIIRLANEGLQITLAISLHNPFDDQRSHIMPINKSYGVIELVKAVDTYIEKTNRRVTFEYALIEGENDSIKHATRLGELLKGKRVHVNLIPINPVKEHAFSPSQTQAMMAFKQTLEKRFGIQTTIRRELGSDINAACGQLRNEKLELSEKSE